MDNEEMRRVIVELPLADHERLSKSAKQAKRSIKAQAEWLITEFLDVISPKAKEDSNSNNSNTMSLQNQVKDKELETSNE